MKSWAAVVALGVAWGGGSAVALPRDPDWPCQAVKVPQLSLATMWAGPSVDAALRTWSSDKQVATLVATLAQRRVSIDDAQAMIGSFATAAGPAKQAKLLALMAGLFDTLNAERSSVVAGLDRYGRRQKELASGIRGEAETLRKQQASATPDAAQVDMLTQRLVWDTRVFEDRRQSVSAACDVLNVIEQRLYRLAQAVQSAL